MTPKSENLFPVDLAVNSLIVDKSADLCILSTHISNLSTHFVDNQTSRVDIFLNDSLQNSHYLSEINPQDSVFFETTISVSTFNLIKFKLEVFHSADFNQENNFAIETVINGENPLVLNEVMFYPDHTKPEWIEIFNRSEQDIDFQDIYIYLLI